MPILAASSGMVMPGCPCTNERASAARVPLPLRRPARRLAGPPALPGALGAATADDAAAAPAAFLRALPRGRPGPRRRVATALEPELEDVVPPTPASAAAA